MDKNIHSLLSQIGTIIKKNDEILDATGSRFNIFGILGVNHYETTHSAILAEFLNPKGSHALGTQFLDKLLEIVGLQFFLDTKQANVITEMWCGENGRMDIVIESCGKAIIIENKIYATDQYAQLKRYQDYANKKYHGNFKILYLTLWGDDASEHSGKDVVYTSISYRKVIIEWLEYCVMLAANYPTVRETINQYINHIKKLTNQDMSTKQKDEIIKIMLENIEASLNIVDNIDPVKEQIVYNCGLNLAKSIGVDSDKVECSQNKILIEYNGYYILFGCDTRGIYASIRTDAIVKQEKLNTIPPIKNALFSSYSAIEWNPYGYSYLNFSLKENSTLIELLDMNSSKYSEMKNWVDKMKSFIDNNILNGITYNN